MLEGDPSFQALHGDQSISVVVVSQNLGFVVAQSTVTISPTAEPAFAFSFSTLLADGVDYVVYYWIDSNIGGGLEGTCDPPENDHQWTTTISGPREDIDISESHDDDDSAEVCFSFPE